jgi:small neutral amino acid transporter SnatA (MarC family)
MMGKYMSVVIGGLVALLGLLGLIRWWSAFLVVLKGSVPAMLIFGGVIAVIAGISEIKDELAAKKEEEKEEEKK